MMASHRLRFALGALLSLSVFPSCAPESEGELHTIREIVDSPISDSEKGRQLLHAIRPGMSLRQLRAILGEAVRSTRYGPGFRESCYERYGIRVFSDNEGTILRTDVPPWERSKEESPPLSVPRQDGAVPGARDCPGGDDRSQL
jgi:hypothetical protein